MEYMEAVKEIARVMRRANSEQPTKEPDWEQRRYEAARELFAVLAAMQDKKDSRHLPTLAFVAVYSADALIKELMELPLPEFYGKKGK